MLRCCLYAETLSSEESESESETVTRAGGDPGDEIVGDSSGEMVGVFTRGVSGERGRDSGGAISVGLG